MYYVVTDSGVHVGKSRNEINKRLDTLFEEEEFKVIGADKIAQVTDIDILFVRDKKRMSRIFFGNFFKEEKVTKICSIMSFVWTMITFLYLFSKLGG